ncbi:MAG: GGDEF domain-containing protein [Rubrivivax sp.]|nr:GGDEF domain-containing protein [Rubrivivax sp.]
MNAPRDPGLVRQAELAELQACLAAAAPAAGERPAAAVEAARRARTLAGRLHRHDDEARAGVWLCTHLLRLGRHDELLRAAPRAQLLLDAPELLAERRELLRLVTLAGSEAGIFDVALASAHELVRSTVGDVRDGAALTASLALAVCFERMGDSWQAVRLLEQALHDHGTRDADRVAAEPVMPLLMATNALCATAIGILHRLLDVGTGAEVGEVLQLARRAGEQARALLPGLPDATYRVAVLGNLGEVMLYQGEVDAAEPLLRESHGLAVERGLVAHGWRVQASMGAWLLARQAPARALETMECLIVEMGADAPPQTDVRARHVAYRACRALGRHADALAHFEAVERLERRRTMAQLRAQSQLFVTRTEAQQAQWQAEQARLEAQHHRERAAEAVARAERDPLTGLGNRRHLAARCAELLPAAQRSGQPLALAQMDIDRFKPVNDRYGHAVGDTVLVEVARLLRENMRTGDVLVRHGGEEFVLVLPGLGLEAAAEVCERLRERFAAHHWLAVCGTPLDLTVSIGVAAAPPYELATLLQRADEALYRAKDGGRNRVCLGSC